MKGKAPRFFLLCTFFMVGCAAIQLTPTAAKVIASRHPAPKNCKFLGMITSSQGGAVAGAFTSNKDLAEGAMNDLRNKAANLGANYVQIETHQAGYTGGSSLSQTDVTLNGNAYNCNPSEIGIQ